MPVPTAQRIRFGAFELDRQSGELFKHGQKLKLQGQPIAVLTLLLERPGELVTREEIRKHLWPEDTFVDFEHSLNTHIKKLRQVFDDDAETPRYIETLPRRGYRFIARVEAVVNGDVAKETAEDVTGSVAVEGQGLKPPSYSGALAARLKSRPDTKRSRFRPFALAAALIVVVTGAALYWMLRPRTPVVTHVRQLTHTGHHKTLGADSSAVFRHPETDGNRVYFDEFGEGKWHLAQVSAKGGEVSYLDTPSINLPKIAGISNDGSELLVAELTAAPNDHPFWVLPLPDGPAHRIPGAFGWAWLLPGTNRIVYQRSSDLKQLFTARPDGSEARPLMSLPGELGPYLALSPDGQRTRFATTDGKVWESRLGGSGMHRFLPEFTAPVCCGSWSRNGGLYVFSGQQEGVWNLWALTESKWPLSLFKARPAQLTNGPVSFRLLTPSNDGKQIFAIGETPRGELSVFDVKSGLFDKFGSGPSAGFTDFSRDGKWMTYVTHPDGMLWRSRIDGSEPMQLTFPPMGPVLNPKWSPDGRFIAFTDLKDGDHKVYLVSADGGAPLLLLSGEFMPADPTWSPDGKFIAYGGPSMFERKPTEIRILNLDTKESRTVPGSQGLFSARWSPDGQYIAAESADMSQLFLYSFQGGSWKQLPSPKPAVGTNLGYPSWSHDSRYVYYMIGTNVYKSPVPGGQYELAGGTANIQIICPVFAWGSWFGLTPDDRILVLRDRSVEEIYALDLEYR